MAKVDGNIEDVTGRLPGKEGMELRGYLKLSGLADYSDLSVRTLRTAIKKRGLPYYKFDDGPIMVKISDFDEWMERYRVGSEAEDIAKGMVDES